MSTSHSVIPYCKLKDACMTSYVVLSEVKCWQAQFFVLDHWSAAAICKHKVSCSLAACELWCIGDAIELEVIYSGWSRGRGGREWCRWRLGCVDKGDDLDENDSGVEDASEWKFDLKVLVIKSKRGKSNVKQWTFDMQSRSIF